MIQVLEIGPGSKPQAAKLWPDAKVTTLDANPEAHPDVLADARRLPEELEGRFEVVFASHILEHFAYWHSAEILKEWKKALKVNGEMHVLTPNLEWVCRKVMDGSVPVEKLLPDLHAGLTTRWDVHLASFTLASLRRVVEEAGLTVFHATVEPHAYACHGERIESEQLYVAGKRFE